MLFKVSAWCVWVSGCQFKSKCFCFQLRIYLIYFQLRPPEVLPQGWKVSWDGPAVSEFQFSQRRISRMQLTATNVWSQIWESKCHLGQILQRRVRCSWQGFKQKRDIFSPLLRCVKMTVAFPGSVKKMTPACLPTRVRFAIIFRFYKSSFKNLPLINLKSFQLPTPRWIPDMGGMRWPVPASWRKMQHILPKRFFCRNIIKMKTFASKVCASWGASACLWWRRAREWGKDELVAKAMAMAKWRVSIRWECDGKCTNISSLCEGGKIITDQICQRII